MVPFGRTAAIFDVDDSLLDGNAGTIFTWYLYSNREMAAAVRSSVPRALYEYARKRLSEADMVALGSRCQQGIRADRLRDGIQLRAAHVHLEEFEVVAVHADYCQARLMPRILEANRQERFDPAILREMGALGFLGAGLFHPGIIECRQGDGAFHDLEMPIEQAAF